MKQYIFKSLNISAKTMFFGTDEEIEQAEQQEQQRKDEIAKLIFNKNFYAIEYFTEYNQRRILHKSTRKGIAYQLSYIDNDGVAAMHENYIETSAEHENAHIGDKNELLTHYLHQSNNNDLILNVYERT
jgi:hypothetical protein